CWIAPSSQRSSRYDRCWMSTADSISLATNIALHASKLMATRRTEAQARLAQSLRRIGERLGSILAVFLWIGANDFGEPWQYSMRGTLGTGAGARWTKNPT